MIGLAARSYPSYQADSSVLIPFPLSLVKYVPAAVYHGWDHRDVGALDLAYSLQQVQMRGWLDLTFGVYKYTRCILCLQTLSLVTISYYLMCIIR